MGVASNTNGYLKRTTNLPVNATGCTAAWWMRLTANAPAPYAQMFGLDTGVGSDYLDIGVVSGTSDLILEKDVGGASYNGVAMLTLTLGAWCFVALKITGATTAAAYWRAVGAGSLSTTGAFGCDNLTWANMYLMGDILPNRGPFEARAFKLWHSVLSDADLLAESFQDAPIVTSGLDSFLPLASAASAGDDVSANNRDWTVLGTFTDIDIPAESRRRRARVMREDLFSDALQRRVMPLAAFGGAPIASIPGPHPRAVRDDVLISDSPARRGLSFAAVAAGAPIGMPWVRRQHSVGDDLAFRVGEPHHELPLRRALPLAALDGAPPVVPPSGVRRPRDRQRGREMRWRG